MFTRFVAMIILLFGCSNPQTFETQPQNDLYKNVEISPFLIRSTPIGGSQSERWWGQDGAEVSYLIHNKNSIPIHVDSVIMGSYIASYRSRPFYVYEYGKIEGNKTFAVLAREFDYIKFEPDDIISELQPDETAYLVGLVPVNWKEIKSVWVYLQLNIERVAIRIMYKKGEHHELVQIENKSL